MDNFLKRSFEFLDACEQETLKRVPTMGKVAPVTFEAVEQALFALHELATCSAGCTGGDHVLERIGGRVFATTEGSLRLACFGLYDESLSLTRSVGEIANLLFLFANDAASRSAWQSMHEEMRKRTYSPVKVRLALEKTAPFVPVEEVRYGRLCDVAVHPTPNTTPQSHNPAGVPTLGGFFQDAGFLVSLNEAAYVLAMSAISLSLVRGQDGRKEEPLARSGMNLLRRIGSVTIDRLDDMLEDLNNSHSGA